MQIEYKLRTFDSDSSDELRRILFFNIHGKDILNRRYFPHTLGLFISYFMIWHRILRPRKRLSDMPISDAEKPTVDVLIPCYTEPVEIIRDTLVAACHIDYPVDKITVNICDDGKDRDEVRALVDAVREENRARGNHVVLRYFRRVKEVGKPHHAKAGNLNNAILNEGTTGQFLVIFDCDMVAESHFLDALIPHFYTRVGGKRRHDGRCLSFNFVASVFVEVLDLLARTQGFSP